MVRNKKDITYYAIKTSLNSLLKFDSWNKLIKDHVDMINKIWFETCFFFNLYILYNLENNTCPQFDKVTIQRCTLFVLGMQKTIRIKDNEYINMNNIYRDKYLPIGNTTIKEYSKIKSIKKPFEFLSTQYMTNIENHAKLNFYKFQKKYLKAIVFAEFSKLNISKKIMYSILNCIQYHLNNNTTEICIRSKILLKFKDLKILVPLMKKIILNEKKNIPSIIINNITYSNLKANTNDVLLYYGKMIKYLEQEEKKRFSVLPQINFGYTYVKFESRYLSTIFDKWIEDLQHEAKKTNIDDIKNKYNINFDLKKVGIKEFEKNYKDFYKKCFNFDKFNLSRKNGIDDNPISISTNGHSVCILFEKKKIEESKNNGNKKINLDNNFIDANKKEKQFKKGLFDADSCTATEDFLNKFNKTSIDPNNDVMLYCYDESGKRIKVTKGYYLEKSHIRINNNKMKKYIRNDKINLIYKEFSEIGHKKTASMMTYINFIKKFREHQDTLWYFYGQRKIKKLELDTYIHKKKAIHDIIRKIVLGELQLATHKSLILI